MHTVQKFTSFFVHAAVGNEEWFPFSALPGRVGDLSAYRLPIAAGNDVTGAGTQNIPPCWCLLSEAELIQALCCAWNQHSGKQGIDKQHVSVGAVVVYRRRGSRECLRVSWGSCGVPKTGFT